MNNQFAEHQFAGSSFEVGTQHGEQLRDQIAQAVDYYSTMLQRSLATFEPELANVHVQLVNNYPALFEQIKGIATAANLGVCEILALNSRSELMNNVAISECTSLCDLNKKLFAQNWDWAEAIAPLMSIQHVSVNNVPGYVTFTEPGMLAKIAINQHAIGAQLNILKTNSRLGGMPVHLLLAMVAQCATLADADALLSNIAPGRASHILLSNGQRALSYEYDDKQVYRQEVTDKPFAHTNHYLQCDDHEAIFATTYERYDFVSEQMATNDHHIGSLLSADSNSPLRPYTPSTMPSFGKVGTVATIDFDFETPALNVKRANCDDALWQHVSV